MTQLAALGILDYVVLIAVLLVSTAIGVYHRFLGGSKETTKDYLLGNQEMGIFPVACSLTASMLSAITMLGAPSEVYTYGLRFTLLNLSSLIATPIMAHVFLPVFHNLGDISIYQYLKLRFGEITRLFVSSVFILQTSFYLAIVLYAPALALSSVSQLPVTASIIIVGVVSTIYSTIGGMKAVLFTDVLQMIVIYGSVITVAVLGTMEIGSLPAVFDTAKNGGRLHIFEFSFDPTITYSFWSLMIGGVATFLTQNAVSQTQIQRLLSIGSMKKAQVAVYFQWFIAAVVTFLLAYSGLIIFSYYEDCDPLLNHEISQNDQLYPYFVIHALGKYPGIIGLAFAGILAGSLSSLSSCLNALSAVIIQDFVKPVVKETFSDRKNYVISQIAVIICGLIVIGLSFTIMKVGGIIKASQLVIGALGGPVLGIFLLGLLVPFSNQIGCIVGSLLSIAFGLYLTFVNERIDKGFPISIQGCKSPNSTHFESLGMTESVTEEHPFSLKYISSLWVTPIITVIVFSIGTLVSFVTKSNNGPVSPTTVLPFMRRFLHTHEFSIETKGMEMSVSEKKQ